MKPDQSVALLRLEIAQSTPDGPVWQLDDWVRPGLPETSEMVRMLTRFGRIVLSLQRQASARTRAKFEPYAEILGVRCRLGERVIGFHFRLEHELLLKAGVATLHPNEAAFRVAVLARCATDLDSLG